MVEARSIRRSAGEDHSERGEQRARRGLAASVLELRGVGPAIAAKLGAAGIEQVVDLLDVLPSNYVDLRHDEDLADPARLVDREIVVRGQFSGVSAVPTRRRGLRIVRARLRTESGSLACVWFNQPYLAKTLRRDGRFLVFGKVTRRREQVQLQNARVLDLATAVPEIHVEYPRVGELGPGAIGRLVDQAVERLANDPDTLRDPLPPTIRERYELPSLADALLEIHRPPSDLATAEVERLRARSGAGHRRLLFDQLVTFQLGVQARSQPGASSRAMQSGPPGRSESSYRIDDEVRRRARQLLPFRLTGDQQEAVRAIVEDMRSPRPMLRLVQGDVGCGKTAVAALAALVAAESGHQTAFLAPTELLAEQHAASLRQLFDGWHRVALITATSDARARDLSHARAPRLIVGTHALLSESVRFDRLALVVIDEQHRFGVAQRESMVTRGERPDVLILTATPIPRSMALFLYGDLELSTIRELPAGRQPIETVLRSPTQRKQVLKDLRRHLECGGQGYVVFPRIREAEDGGVSLEGMEAAYRDSLQPFRCAVVTGDTPADDRQRSLEQFRAGTIDCLLATTVIEVGVDVANASIMVIEGAERFGLAQLHQLRGRVGRGERTSRCVAIASPLTAEAEERLAAFASTQDGFELAELDLRLRGPGQLLGAQQSGSADRLLVRALDESELLEHSRCVARDLWLDARRAEEQSPGSMGRLLHDFGVPKLHSNRLAGG